MPFLLKNCRLIPELSGGFSSTYANVLVSDSKIISISPYDPASQPDTEAAETTEVIDCKGKTLLPGLFDIHMHINWAYHLGEIRLTDFKILLESMASAGKYLEHGITTIRDMGSAKRVANAVRSAIESGLIPGPRMLTSGLILNPTSRDAVEPYIFLRHVSGTDEMLRACREEIGSGADFVKVYAPGDPCALLPEELETAVRIARIHRKKVAVHAHDLDAIRLCIEKGVDSIEHASFIDEACIEALKDSPIRLVPTLAVLSPLVGTPGYTKEMKATVLAPILKANSINITNAYKAGLKLGFGTDTPIEEFDQAPGLEFKMRKEYCHMENVDILLQATKYSAEICGLRGITGEIKEGMDADLILVDGNPDEDISVMYNKPEKVWARGKLYNK